MDLVTINILTNCTVNIDVDDLAPGSHIITKADMGTDRDIRLYTIETSEEDASYLTLKFGAGKVWKR